MSDTPRPYPPAKPIPQGSNLNNEVLYYRQPGAEHLHSPKRDGDIGHDLCALREVTLQPGEHMLIPTGLHIDPGNRWGWITPRSSTSKKCVHVFPGIMDRGYRGEYMISALNLSHEPVTFPKGKAIAQVIFFDYQIPPVREVVLPTHLSPSERGDAGFGSTNIEA